MKKILVLVLAGAIWFLAACMPVQTNTSPTAPATEPPALVIQTPVPPAASPTPLICPPGWYATTYGCARPFLQPIPSGCHSGNVASSDVSLYPIGVDGTVFVALTEKARAGMRIERGLRYIVYGGYNEGVYQYSIITFPVENNPGYTEFRFDGGGVAIKGDYLPGVLLDRWYNTADSKLAAEIKGLMDLIKTNSLRLPPVSDQGEALLCIPTP